MTRQWIKHHFSAKFPTKKRSYKYLTKIDYSLAKDTSHSNKEKNCALDVTSNYIESLYSTESSVQSFKLEKRLDSVITTRIVPVAAGICLSGFAVVSSWFFAVKSVKKKRNKNWKAQKTKCFFWPLTVIWHFNANVRFEYESERKIWTKDNIQPV